MPAMAIEDIRRKLVTATSGKIIERLKQKATDAGHAGSPVMVKFVAAKQSTESCGPREVIGHISVETPDEDGDVILQGGWEFSYFEKHRECLGFHDYFTYPTGKCLWWRCPKRVSPRTLTVKTAYATKPPSWPDAQEWPPDTILDLRRQEIMKGYSVGFVLLEERPPTEKEIKAHQDWQGCRIIARAKLLEYSDVPLPCNADAMQILVGKGLLPKPEADDDEPDTTATDDTAGPATDAGELGGERGVPANPDGDTARDADDADSTRDSVVDAGGDAGAVLGTASVADPDGVETKPSAENHACEINDGEYSRYRSEKRDSDGKPYTVRFGIRVSDGEAEEVTYFYPVADWTASQARSHCKSHDGTFEAATEGDAAREAHVGKGEAPSGSWEDMRDQLQAQLLGYLREHGIALADDDDAWTWIRYMADDYTIVHVTQGQGEVGAYYRIAWERGANGPVFVGSPEPVELDVEIHPMSAGAVRETPADMAHLQVLREIAAGKYVKLDEEAIEQAALEKAVEEQLAYHRGHLG